MVIVIEILHTSGTKVFFYNLERKRESISAALIEMSYLVTKTFDHKIDFGIFILHLLDFDF